MKPNIQSLLKINKHINRLNNEFPCYDAVMQIAITITLCQELRHQNMRNETSSQLRLCPHLWMLLILRLPNTNILLDGHLGLSKSYIYQMYIL